MGVACDQGWSPEAGKNPVRGSKEPLFQRNGLYQFWNCSNSLGTFVFWSWLATRICTRSRKTLG